MDVAVSENATCILKDTGALMCWINGQWDNRVPVTAPPSGLSPILDLVVSNTFAAVIAEDGCSSLPVCPIGKFCLPTSDTAFMCNNGELRKTHKVGLRSRTDRAALYPCIIQLLRIA